MATDYKKFVRDNDVESGVLLGNYNENDTYQIANEVKDELITLRKLITVYKQDYLLCEARILDTTLKFKIKFFVDSLESEKYASIYLLESYSSFGKKIELETFLVNFKTANDHTFLDKIKDKFHLLTQEDLGDGKDIDNKNEILEKILNTKKTVSKSMILEMGIDNRKYCNDILKILKNSKSYPKLEKIIKMRMAGIKADKNTAKYFALLKQILDQIIIEYYDELEEETKKWLEQVNQNYVLIYMNKKKEVQKPKKKQDELVVAKPKKSAEKKKPIKPPKKKPEKKKPKGKVETISFTVEPYLPTFEEMNKYNWGNLPKFNFENKNKISNKKVLNIKPNKNTEKVAEVFDNANKKTLDDLLDNDLDNEVDQNLDFAEKDNPKVKSVKNYGNQKDDGKENL